jgi:hypothetical protein
MEAMKTLALFLVFAAVSPLSARSTKRAQNPRNAQSVVAPCQLVSADLSFSGESTPQDGRGFSLHVANRNSYSIALPASPEFGWMVERRRGSGWKRAAEGGTVRRIGSGADVHLAVIGPTGTTPVVELAPGAARDIRFFLPQSDAALRPDPSVQLTTLRLSVFWAASNELRIQAPNLPRCGIAASWNVSLERPAAAQAAGAR